jgi:predicted transcriptional regulator
MSRNDTGIDCSDLLDTIVQCKLRKNTLTWKECATFLEARLFLVMNLKNLFLKADNLVITRNNDYTLSKNGNIIITICLFIKLSTIF